MKGWWYVELVRYMDLQLRRTAFSTRIPFVCLVKLIWRKRQASESWHLQSILIILNCHPRVSFWIRCFVCQCMLAVSEERNRGLNRFSFSIGEKPQTGKWRQVTENWGKCCLNDWHHCAEWSLLWFIGISSSRVVWRSWSYFLSHSAQSF